MRQPVKTFVPRLSQRSVNEDIPVQPENAASAIALIFPLTLRLVRLVQPANNESPNVFTLPFTVKLRSPVHPSNALAPRVNVELFNTIDCNLKQP